MVFGDQLVSCSVRLLRFIPYVVACMRKTPILNLFFHVELSDPVGTAFRVWCEVGIKSCSRWWPGSCCSSACEMLSLSSMGTECHVGHMAGVQASLGSCLPLSPTLPRGFGVFPWNPLHTELSSLHSHHSCSPTTWLVIIYSCFH